MMTPNEMNNINRFEVIDCEGRTYVRYLRENESVQYSLQDDNRTLKIFITQDDSQMIDDNTEIQISLKTIISVIVAVVAMTSVVVRYEIKVDSLLAKIGKLEIHIQNSSKIIHENSESVRSLQIEQIKQQKDIQYITLIGETECPKK